ncbi:uncharacterized protein LACBIDRAFT_312198 [Laccaria bicolor S238N-H82]|uniref:Predicted protein n=1 Tax=Laccaria bicolor (strain S238N-H82 / ATCC MYA-4686) TaxID=486041 RepID=B0DVQ4_LACBS|nr:uncharacterized protein LACBIDRAFT_312198 [Laccaria bicolor S238N-H82]EDR01291.1 predicted protein [Laccaria bicolor S238N-H82]|eukprot:XP_001887998.1 predicted protein [Laccaria bicolor S238N-H82]
MLLRCPALIWIVVAWPFVVTLSLIIAIQSEVVVIDDVHLFHLALLSSTTSVLVVSAVMHA